MHEVIINGKRCFFKQNGEGGPVILVGLYAFKPQGVEYLWKCLMELVHKTSFLLVAFELENLNRDASPWATHAVRGFESFGGGGRHTLEWVTEQCIPYVKQNYGDDRKIMIAGYSLSGLFALWAIYASDQFAGAASCSGSLWFPQWDTFMQNASVKVPSIVYLSLGDGEEKTRNEVMKVVGDRTRMQEQILKKDPNVKSVVLEWNEGGHFEDPGRRVALGIQWLITNCDQ